MNKIQDAYTGSELANYAIYETILNASTNQELVSLINNVVLGDNTVNNNLLLCAIQPNYANANFVE
jgi:hypothetical protein